MAVLLKVNGTDRTSSIKWSSLAWVNNLTNRVDTLNFSIMGQSLPFTISLDDTVELLVDGTSVFGGKVITMTDSVQASSLKRRDVKCKDYTADMDRFYYTAEFKTQTPLYNLIRDLTHTINKRDETRIAEFETDESWSSGVANTTQYRRGSQSLELTSSGSYVTAQFSPSSAIDLTGQENITWDNYIDDSTVLAGIRIRLGDSTLTNYYEYEITSGATDEWNNWRIARTSFTATGTPDWSAIAKIEVACDSTGTDTVNVSFDDMYSIDSSAFTMDNVDVEGRTIESVKFGFKLPSGVLKRYAQVTGLDWYVDANKDIHFFSTLTNTALFELTDTGGNHIYDSLKIKQDISKLRNVVYIFGGEAVATNDTTEELGYQADGTLKDFQLARRYDLSTVTLTVNAVTQTVGVEGTDTFAGGYNALYNVDEKTIAFNTAPASGVAVNWTGKRLFPLSAKISDATSVATYGEKEITIKEKDIITFDSAIQRSIAEFTEYASENIDGSFRTDKQGLRAGQRIHLNLANRGIDEWYIIQRVSGKMRTATDMTFDVQLVSTKQFNMIEILQMLLAERLKGIEDYQSDNLIDGTSEIVNISDVVTASTGTEITDTANISEVINYWLNTSGTGGDPLSYVAGNYEPTNNSDFTRTPCADGGGTLAS